MLNWFYNQQSFVPHFPDFPCFGLIMKSQDPVTKEAESLRAQNKFEKQPKIQGQLQFYSSDLPLHPTHLSTPLFLSPKGKGGNRLYLKDGHSLKPTQKWPARPPRSTGSENPTFRSWNAHSVFVFFSNSERCPHDLKVHLEWFPSWIRYSLSNLIDMQQCVGGQHVKSYTHLYLLLFFLGVVLHDVNDHSLSLPRRPPFCCYICYQQLTTPESGSVSLGTQRLPGIDHSSVGTPWCIKCCCLVGLNLAGSNKYSQGRTERHHFQLPLHLADIQCLPITRI